MSVLNWIQDWYSSQCDGHWEHTYGVTIGTTDNPGWSISIDISNTELEGMEVPYRLIEKSDENWFGLKVENNLFRAFGDPSKLEFLLLEFKRMAEDPNGYSLPMV